MPALDQCHQQVVNALIKAGWQVDPQPLRLDLPNRHLFVDILAQRINEDEQKQIIVIEVKCFSNPDKETTELYTAIGQYIVYRKILSSVNSRIPIYLSVPTHIYYGIFEEIGFEILREEDIHLIVVNLEDEQIEEWV